MSKFVHLREVAVLRQLARSSREGTFIGGAATLTSAFIWGAVEGGISRLGLNALTLACAIGLISGALITVLVPDVRRNLLSTVRAVGRGRVVAMCLLDTLNGICVYVALSLAPVGPVIAVHMTSPVILMIGRWVTGRRPVNRRGLWSFALLSMGLLVIGVGGDNHGQRQYDHLGFGLLFAFAGAVAVIFLLTLANGIPQHVSALRRAGVNGLLSGAITIPFALSFGDLSARQLGWSALVALIVTPAAALNWLGMKRLKDPVKYGALNLIRPFVASLYVLVVYHQAPAPAHYVAMSLIMAGIYLCLTEAGSSFRPREAVP